MQKTIAQLTEDTQPDPESSIPMTSPTAQSRRTTLRNARRFVVGEKPTMPETGNNACSGFVVLVGGTVTVNTNSVTENTRIHYSVQENGQFTGNLRVSARNPGVSFTLSSSVNTDTCGVAWFFIEDPDA